MRESVTTVGKVGIGIAVGLLLFWLFWSPVPATHQPHFEEQTPSDLKTVRATAADLDERLASDEEVFVQTRANYYAGSDIDHAWTSRLWILVREVDGNDMSPGTQRYQRVREDLVNKLETGEIGVILMTPRTGATIREWPATRRAFHEHYCRVEPRPAVYERLQTHIYEYVGDDKPADCTSKITVAWGADT